MTSLPYAGQSRNYEMISRRQRTYTVGVISGIAENMCTHLDRLPRKGETLHSGGFHKHNGGKGANSAIATFRLSHLRPRPGNVSERPRLAVQAPDISEIHVYMTGAVGEDEHGPDLSRALSDNFVNVEKVDILKHEKSGINTILVDASDDAHIIHTAHANEMLEPDKFKTAQDLAGGIVLYLIITQLEIGWEICKRIIKTATDSGVDVLLNASPAYALDDSVY